MAIWTLAKKDLRLLLRDRRAMIILLAMPFIFILILGLSLGEGFGQKPDDRLRVSLVDLDQGDRFSHVRDGLSGLTAMPPCGPLGAVSLAEANRLSRPLADYRPSVVREALAGLGAQPGVPAVGVAALVEFNRRHRLSGATWAQVVQFDLDQTAGIRVEIIPSLEEAQRLIRDGQRSAVLVFQPTFSERVTLCSFLADGINPFYRDGVQLRELDAVFMR